MHRSKIPVHDPGPDQEISALADRARGGNPEAFEALADRLRDRIRRWAREITNDGDDADDVAQLVLIKLRSKVTKFEGRSRFTTWLNRITKNIALNRRRREFRRERLLSAQALGEEHDQGTDRTEIAARLATLVRQYFLDLPPRQREIFELADFDGLDSTEIAERLGISPSTVRVQLRNARRHIRLRIVASHPNLVEDYRE